MRQAVDFLEESEVLYEFLADLSEADFDRVTGFKNWTVNDVLTHLHFWNLALWQALSEPQSFKGVVVEITAAMTMQGGLRRYENNKIKKRGQALLETWHNQYTRMAMGWQNVDPKRRVQWAGPDMSARSAITARQMETWAHAHEVFDLLGQVRKEHDRIKNIVILGINTYRWSFTLHGVGAPEPMPHVALTAPSGEEWQFGEMNLENQVRGSALGFAQTVTQTRNVADTDISTKGPVAKSWMARAQCFAGPPEKPPPAGTRCLNVKRHMRYLAMRRVTAWTTMLLTLGLTACAGTNHLRSQPQPSAADLLTGFAPLHTSNQQLISRLEHRSGDAFMSFVRQQLPSGEGLGTIRSIARIPAGQSHNDRVVIDVVHGDLPDDSVQKIFYRFILDREGSIWVVSGAGEQHLCHRGPTPAKRTTKNCL